MSDVTALDRVILYHAATKHRPDRYARSPGYLDWATQPNPFRRYDGAPLVELVLGPRENEPPYDSLFDPGRVRAAPLNRSSVSAFFECSLGISAWKSYRDSTWALRCNPSSGNLHPTEAYLIAGPIAGIGESGGIYHYAPSEHALELRHSIEVVADMAAFSETPGECFLVGLSSVFWREAWKYGERAFRYCQHDVGHAIACLRFAAAMQGWRLRLVDVADEVLARLLGLDRIADRPAVEREHAEALCLVSMGPAPVRFDLTSGWIDAVTAGPWYGTANALSPRHVEWDIIDVVADATRRTDVSRGPVEPISATIAPASSPALQSESDAPTTPATAREIILRRRSATDFDGRTVLPLDSFAQMLRRLVPDAEHPSAPWDALSWSPRIHLLMFVHRVDGLTPGLYGLVRDSARLDALRAATKLEFEWRKSDACPDDLPLYLLMEADCRRAATQLSLGQAIAGDGAFSLGMVAEFEASLREFGPWFYRRLFWEAGMIGQVLYLEAEAAAVRAGNKLRATGIGAYFDDMVHEVFGLSGRAFQSLYHFTVGGAVDDPRLTTRPGYDKSLQGRR